MGKGLDNKTLRTRYSYQRCVLLVNRDGVIKYISKDYGKKNCWSYTVLLNKAKIFDSLNHAERFAEGIGLCDYQIRSVEVKVQLLPF